MEEGTFVVEAWVLSRWRVPPHDIHRECPGKETTWYVRAPAQDDTQAVRIRITNYVMQSGGLAKERLRQADKWVPALKAGEYRGIRLTADGVHPLAWPEHEEDASPA